MPGHLFVAQTDLRYLHCDAWAISTDSAGWIDEQWTRDDPELASLLQDLAGHRDALSGNRVVRVAGRGAEPELWAVNVADDYGREKPAWFADGARRFVELAGTAVRSGARGRPPLLAVPLVGTGAGGGRSFAGDILLEQFRSLLAYTARDDAADVAVVVTNREALAAAQQARSRAAREAKVDLWSDLGEAQRKAADVVGRKARQQLLVPFLGAGVSTAAGLPDWQDLLDDLTDAAHLGGRRQELDALDPRDRALLCRNRMGEKAFEKLMTAKFEARRPSLSHALLASLPVREAATTNYDRLFEFAWKAAPDAGSDPGEVVVLPGGRGSPGRHRWLLKLHGSIETPGSIVLARDDYLDFDRQKVALAGVVQAMLLTRAMLFVGFSLTDDNFSRIVHDVRAARGTAFDDEAHEPFGTALTLSERTLFQDLWEGDVDFVCLGSPRRVDIFLDYVVSLASEPGSYLLNPAFRALLSDDEARVADLLREAASAVGSPQTPALDRVREALGQLGA